MEAPPWRRRARYKGRAAPPWKETYRLRCMERLRSSRAKLLERYRRAGESPSGPALVREVMEQEWRALQALGGTEALPQMLEDPDELAVLEEIQQELILQEQLVMEEYEQSLQFDEECLNAMLDGLDASDKIICPVCRKNNLTVRNHVVFCQCGLYISTQDMTEGKLRSLLENTVTEHSHRCFHSPEFTVTSGMEEEASLLMSCAVCDSWTILL
ncbi:RPA-interacting protein isoform X1 [Pezoporus wallicus]|uniref:RPA-interacting protein n=1 Tax=Pezoporus flaviventris TaxID=889875 RepID=UPI002550DCCE|nr:RPA-interacting protein isoform X1 [Pezoporus wallicus]XP_061326396.1 RPA-interacting protein [Pezoporus flaviventris]